MDPTVQVAAFGIIATVISTLGVVAVAYINKQSPSAIKPVESEHEDGRDNEAWDLLIRERDHYKRLADKCRREHR